MEGSPQYQWSLCHTCHHGGFPPIPMVPVPHLSPWRVPPNTNGHCATLVTMEGSPQYQWSLCHTCHHGGFPPIPMVTVPHLSPWRVPPNTNGHCATLVTMEGSPQYQWSLCHTCTVFPRRWHGISQSTAGSHESIKQQVELSYIYYSIEMLRRPHGDHDDFLRSDHGVPLHSLFGRILIVRSGSVHGVLMARTQRARRVQCISYGVCAKCLRAFQTKACQAYCRTLSYAYMYESCVVLCIAK